MRANTFRRRCVATRLVAVIMLLVASAVPAVTGFMKTPYEEIDFDYMRVNRTCDCHDPLISENVQIFIDCPDQVSWTPENRSVKMTIGILGQPDNSTGFGVMLNGSVTNSSLLWNERYGNNTTMLEESDLVKIDGNLIYNMKAVYDDWFNLSFIPGQADQEVEIVVLGMRCNDDKAIAGDTWAIDTKTIEVREQRMLNLTVAVHNNQPIAVNEVLVAFYINDEYIGNTTIFAIHGNSVENATFFWDVTFKEDGKYIMKAEIDPHGNITELNKGNNIVVREIWLGELPEEESKAWLYSSVGFFIIIALVVGGYVLYRRRLYRF